MAQKVQITLVDDLDGSPADETVQFGLDGVAYEIDLSSANAAALRESLGRYVGSARRLSGRRGRSGSTARGDSDAHLIRTWAKQRGLEVSERGRIPAEVRRAYEADPST
jgi:hypothetical protein